MAVCALENPGRARRSAGKISFPVGMDALIRGMDRNTMFVAFALWVAMGTGCGRTAFPDRADGAGQPDTGAGKKPDTKIPLDTTRDDRVDWLMTCAQINRSVWGTRQKVLETAKVEHPCQSVDDCVLVQESVSCAPACSTYVSVAAGKILDGYRKAEENDLCALYTRQGCPVIPIPPCMAPMQPNTCMRGQCIREH